jgi:hypothetical protein
MVISRDFASGLTQYPLICYVSTDANFCLYSMPLFLSHFTVSLRYFVGSASAPHSHAAELGSHCSLLRIQNAPTFFQCSTANFKLRFIYFASWDFFLFKFQILVSTLIHVDTSESESCEVGKCVMCASVYIRLRPYV